MSARELLMTAGGRWDGKNWISALQYGVDTSPGLTGIATDASTAIYLTGQNKFRDIKYSTSGNVEFQEFLGTVSRGWKIHFASSYFYVIGDDGASSSQQLLGKYDSTGSLQWQRALGSNTGRTYGVGVGADSSDNVYTVCQTGASPVGTSAALVAKYNSSGTLQWQRILYNSGASNSGTYGTAIAVNGSGDSYVIGLTSVSDATPESRLLVAKYNSSGTIQWQVITSALPTPIDRYSGYAANLDSSGNLYVAININNYADGLVLKYNSSGTLQWQRAIYACDGFEGIAIDSSSNVYVAGYETIAKYNSSGTLQWLRRLVAGYIYGIAMSGDDNFALAIENNMVARLPSDGSKTGTYGAFVYSTSSLSTGTPTYTSSAASLTDAAGSLAGSTPTYSETATTYTNALTSIS